MRDRTLRISLAFCLLFLLPAAPALQALPFHRGAETAIEAPADVFAGLLDRIAAWLGWNEPRPTWLAAEDPQPGDDPQPKPTDDNGTCLDPSGAPVPCKP